MIPLKDRIAGAPITWGVDGSPGWGYLLPRGRVLEEMASIGLSATELGPDGFLGRTPQEARQNASSAGLSVVGGFVPLLLHLPAHSKEQSDYADRAIKTLSACGSQVMVLGPELPQNGYDLSQDLSPAHWTTFERNLKRLIGQAGEEGLEVALHQHWGMAVEKPRDLERVLTNTEVSLCLDTGHMFLAGIDPLAIARSVPDRVAHVHLKDVHEASAARVRSGEITFRQGVKTGLFRPLGLGDVDIGGVITVLERAGYQGWYVLEQDKILRGKPPLRQGPVEDAAVSTRYLGELVEVLEEPGKEKGCGI
ncbi:MAG: TIM barrel protein [bacterium]|nr:TIM barrel protein [Acidimicrobiia bacterium]MCY4648833.1 TIM barrel protein [bacterium]